MTRSWSLAPALVICVTSIVFCSTKGDHVDHKKRTSKNSAMYDYFFEAMNPKAAPCENFYEHVCGNIGSIKSKFKSPTDTLADAISKIDLGDSNIPSYYKSVKIFLQKCESFRNESSWMKDLYELAGLHLAAFPPSNNHAGAFPNSTAAWRLDAALHRHSYESLFIRSASINNSAVAFFYTPYFFENACDQSHGALRSIAMQLAGNLGLTNETKEALIENWTFNLGELCNELKNVTADVDTRPNETDTVLLRDSSRYAPYFEWDAYLQTLIPNQSLRTELIYSSRFQFHIRVKHLAYLDRTGQILRRHSLDTVRSLAFLILIYGIERDYEDKAGCLGIMEYSYPATLVNLYFNYTGQDPTWLRHEVQAFRRTIYSAFHILLNSVGWLDSEDREKLRQKVDSIKFLPGVPDWINNETKIQQRTPECKPSLSYFQNQFRIRANLSDIYLSRLAEGVTLADYLEFEVAYPSLQNSGFYSRPNSLIVIFLGAILPPRFDDDYVTPIKYGSTGVMGHELMHAFDAKGITLAPARAKPWLKETTLAGYKRQQECLAAQYSRFCTDDKAFCISGENTLNENLADIGGIKISYVAYKFVSQLEGRNILPPVLDNYTSDQLFFIAYARRWCRLSNPESDFHPRAFHAPAKARVDILLTNTPLFAKAFHCPVGSKYAPLKACAPWGQMANSVKVR